MMEKQKRELLILTPVVVYLALLPVLRPDIYYLSARIVVINVEWPGCLAGNRRRTVTE